MHTHTCMALWFGSEIYLTKVDEQVAHFVERIWAMGETGGEEEIEMGGRSGYRQTSREGKRERERERGRADGRMMN